MKKIITAIFLIILNFSIFSKAESKEYFRLINNTDEDLIVCIQFDPELIFRFNRSQVEFGGQKNYIRKEINNDSFLLKKGSVADIFSLSWTSVTENVQFSDKMKKALSFFIVVNMKGEKILDMYSIDVNSVETQKHSEVSMLYNILIEEIE